MHKYAFLVGCSEYEHLTPLPFVVNDVREFGTVLQEVCGFEVVQTCVGQEAMHSDLEDRVDRFFSAPYPPGTLLLLYFSGHGLLDGNTQGFLACYNTHRKVLLIKY